MNMMQRLTALPGSRLPDLFPRGLAPLLLTAAILGFPGVTRATDAATDNPHWKSDACIVCHESADPEVNSAALNTATAEDRCLACHQDGEAVACPHLSGISVDEGGLGELPESYSAKLHEGEITCTTCHDLQQQCTGPQSSRYRNPAFVRNGPFLDSSAACFECHQSSAYRKLSPHRQLRRGKVIENSCIFCHSAVPQSADGEAPGFRFPGDLSLQCYGCHPVAPHPGSMFGQPAQGAWNHLVKPSKAVLLRMQDTEARTGARLPLDPHTGRVFCATCHNPHADGLEGYPAADPAGDSYKLRVPDICGACHDI